MLVNSLIAILARELRDVSAPFQFTDDDLHSALIDAIDDMNIEYHQQHIITGTGVTAAISPEPDTFSKKIWILYGALQLMQGERMRNAAAAIVISNAGGRTDLTSIPEEIGNAVSALRARLNGYLTIVNRGLIEGQMEALEKTRQAV